MEEQRSPEGRKVIGSLGGHRSIVTLVQIGNDVDAHVGSLQSFSHKTIIHVTVSTILGL